MSQTKDLKTRLDEVVIDHMRSCETSSTVILAEIDRLRSSIPEIAARAGLAAAGEHPAARLARVFRMGCEHGLRDDHIMDVAARLLTIWDAHPSDVEAGRIDQIERCADAVERLMTRAAA